MLDENTSVNELLMLSTNLIQDANFDEALRYYYYIQKVAEKNAIPEDLIQFYENYRDSIVLYLAIQECFVLVHKNEMDLLKEKLDFIYFEKRTLFSRLNYEKLIKYFDEHYHYLLGYYMYNFYKNRFLREFENIYYFMHAGWTEKAAAHYNTHLLKYYNKLAKYGNHQARNTLYNAIINLNRELKLTSFKQQAYSEIAGYTFKSIKRERRKEIIEHVPRKLKTVETIKFHKKPFKKLHELIKENKADEALNLYNKLLYQNI
ncbi:hypothetical protein HYX18_00040 [Candidatus Woesearchaeota archaeon]|nr:hypothetical protein [Candidatus Woesearchaeota archaeon]